MRVSRYRKFIRRARTTPLKALRRAWQMYRSGGLTGMIEVVQTYAEINRQYAIWCAQRQKIPPLDIQALRTHPCISIIMPTYNSDARWLRLAIESVLAQIYPHWELCIADDASPQGHVREVLNEYASRDTRIKVCYREANGHISAASNTALEMATGEYIALLDHDDEISPDALLEVTDLLNQHPDADFVYSDEDKIEPDGVTHTEPFFKPAWSPHLLLSCNYITHFAVIRRSLVEQVGGFRDAFVGSQDHDLFLRVSDHTNRVHHIPKVLYSWRKIATSTADGIEAKTYALEAAFRAVHETVERRGIDATVERGLYDPFLRVRYRTPDDAVKKAAALQFGAPVDNHDYLLFSPKGTSISSDSVHALVELASQPNIGAVGGKIVSPRRKLLHAGMALGVNGVAGFPGSGMSDITQAIFYMDLKDTIREVLAVSQGFMMIERKKFLEVGGFDKGYQRSLFDVDVCLRLKEAGYTNMYTPFARSVVRDTSFLSIDPADAARFRDRWGEPLDPYYNRNLTRIRTNMHIAL